MTPSPDIYPDEHEFSAPGGVDVENVICYRECIKNESSWKPLAKCSSIFFNKQYLDKFSQTTMEKIKESQLFNGEELKEKKISPF